MARQKAFEPFNEKDDARYNEWKNEDHTDEAIPNIPGFITDFVYATRGREIASLYAVWSAIFAISSVLQRDAWMMDRHGDPWLDREYINMYLLMIGPAGCGKSSAIKVIQKVLAGAMFQLKESGKAILERKDATIISNMSTPEAFLSALHAHTKDPETKQRRQILDKESKEEGIQTIKAIGNGLALISEFGSLLGKAKYMETMSTILLDLYDCPSMYRWNTVKRGHINIPEVFYNLVGATTLDSVASNVNTAIMQDGFLSRTILAYVDGFPRSRVERFKTNCSVKDLIIRLTWIAETQTGAYMLSQDARNKYREWYEDFMRKMNKNPEKAGYMIRNRGLVLKVATILKISDYTPGHEVELEHLEAAFKLVNYTYKSSDHLINYMANSSLAGAKQFVLKLVSNKKAGVTRRTLALKIGKYPADIVDQALKELWMEGKITVIQNGGKNYGKSPECLPTERYTKRRINSKSSEFRPKNTEKSEVYERDTEYVSEWDSGDDDSQNDGDESVVDIRSAQRVWG